MNAVYTSARLYVDAKGRTCCQLTHADGYAPPPSLLKPGEAEQLALPWCERNGVTVIDDRHLTMPARERLDNEAALYKLERP